MYSRDLICRMAENQESAFVLTDADLDPPGPTILFVNSAFCRMTGYSPDEVIGRSPRILQGRGTNSMTSKALGRSLRAGAPFHGVITNYRSSGEEYLCEVNVEPLFSCSGELEGFFAFEREVKRRRGRPRTGWHGRYEPA
jgi:PAS domain S-box-containing protein